LASDKVKLVLSLPEGHNAGGFLHVLGTDGTSRALRQGWDMHCPSYVSKSEIILAATSIGLVF